MISKTGVFLIFSLVAGLALATSVPLYSASCAGTSSLAVDVVPYTCYGMPAAGTCTACNNTAAANGLGWNEAMLALGCTNVTSSFRLVVSRQVDAFPAGGCNGTAVRSALPACFSVNSLCGASSASMAALLSGSLTGGGTGPRWDMQ